jgi:hypothetical protein
MQEAIFDRPALKSGAPDERPVKMLSGCYDGVGSAPTDRQDPKTG